MIVALGLGALYAAGAFVKTGQLQDADVSVKDTLPLVPLEQFLALGIGIVTSSLLSFISLVAVVFVALVLGGWQTQPESGLVVRGRHIESWPTFSQLIRSRATRPGLIFIAVIALSTFAAYNVFDAVLATGGLILGLSLAWIAGNPRLRSQRHRWLINVVAGYFCIVVATRLAVALIVPDPLSAVTLRMRTGTTVRASLIATTGNTWYVSRRQHTFEAIQATDVASARVQDVNVPKLRPPLKVAWDALFEEIRQRL